MRRTAQPVDDSVLFDLPLVAEPELSNKPRPRSEPRPEPGPEPAVEIAEAEQISLPEKEPEEAVEPSLGPQEGEDAGAGLLHRRSVAGAIDASLLAAALSLMVIGAAAMGIRPALADWPGYALVALVLSFLYSVFSLVFWGKTPGMQRTGLEASSPDGSPVTIGQACLRWLGGVGTVVLLGLPTLLDLRGGGSLSDRISGTRVSA